MRGTRTNVTVARGIIDANRYLTCATADERGVPWASPVWYAEADYREFFWVSAPEARHSRNIALRPQVALVIFDSTMLPGNTQAVYMAAVAVELSHFDLDRALTIFNRRSVDQGLRAWTLDDLRAPARHRLYCATASQHFVLSARDERVPVELT
jgi:uncharacterized protein YhbP (UPF0306 family)